MIEKRRGDSQSFEKEQSEVLGDDRKEKGRRRIAYLIWGTNLPLAQILHKGVPCTWLGVAVQFLHCLGQWQRIGGRGHYLDFVLGTAPVPFFLG